MSGVRDHTWRMTDPVAVLADLVGIASVNPDLVPGASGESAIADYCCRWLSAHGLVVHRLESRPGRPTVVGIARGTGGGRSLMLNGHYDTVTLAGYDGDPLESRISGGKLHGRGSFDMKGGVAAAMVAVARAQQRGVRGDVLVACVADEEHSSWGTEEVLRAFSADAGIVTEPSHLEITLSHKGFVWFDVTILGRAAHGSRPELGIDAIAEAGHFLVALDAWGKRLRDGTQHHALGAGSVHASVIRGGEEASSYPAECRITIERRTVPGENADTVEAELREILETLTGTVPDFAYRLRRGLGRDPFEADPGHPIVTMLASHAERRLGRRPRIRSEPFWTDCALLQAAGIPSLMFGADGGGAHAAHEWTTIESVRQVADILTETAIEFCG
jgi:acetylornithine deacetylase